MQKIFTALTTRERVDEGLIWNLCWKMMKISIVQITLALIFSGVVMAERTFGQEVLDRQVSISMKDVSLKNVLSELETATKVRFVYSRNRLKLDDYITIDVTDMPLGEVLDQLLAPRDIQYNVQQGNDYIVLKQEEHKEVFEVPDMLKGNREILNVIITGKVTDEKDQPLPGTTVMVKGTSSGTTTDIGGNYRLSVPDNATTLVFSFIGYKTVEELINARNVVDVSMALDATSLKEVVINAGYYETSQELKTGNISTVESKVIEQQPVSNPLAALQGRMPGVEIIPSTGLPGAGFTVRIRGQNSITKGNEPLYIIDGTPFSSQSMSYRSTSQIHRGDLSPFSLINPADIERIEVLKDGDATAIYGSRGANGVILITTKRGKEGKARLNVSYSKSLGKITRFMDYLTTEQYLEMRREAFANDGLDMEASTDPSVNGTWPADRYTNWQEYLMGETAHTNDLQVSFSGGSDRTQFVFGGGYRNETAVIIGDNKYKRGSILANVNHSSEDDRLNIMFSTNLAVDNGSLPVYDAAFAATTLPPNAPFPYNEDGSLHFEQGYTNPLSNLLTRYSNERYNVLASSTIGYKLLPGLEIKTNMGVTYTSLEDYAAYPGTVRYAPPYNISDYSSITRNNSTRRSWNLEPQLNWIKQIGKGKINVLTGVSFQEQVDRQFIAMGQGFSTDKLITNLSAATNKYINSDSENQYKYHAVFGRINYNWLDRYIINLTGRRDGSSRFGPNNKFANFGAVGAAWIFSKESFFPKDLFLSYGKLRSSFGTSGNDQIGDYEFLDTYTITSTPYDGVISMNPSRLYNPNFAWEENRKLEVALELGFFQDRIFFTGSFYRNISSNQLVGMPLPITTGFTSLTSNLDAKVMNKGLEFELHTINIQKKDFEWTSSFNISIARNKLLEFPGLEASTYANQFVVGEPLNIMKLYNFTGFSDDGLYTYEDYNKDGVLSSPFDRQVVMDLTPKSYGGLNNSVTYRNWSLEVFFQFTQKKAYNTLHSSLPGGGGNKPAIILDRWKEAGDDPTVQRYTTGANSEAYQAYDRAWLSTLAYTNASFIRLKNIAVSYSIPSHVLKGIGCRFFVQGQNLFTITEFLGADPEQASQRTGLIKRVNMGLALNF